MPQSSKTDPSAASFTQLFANISTATAGRQTTTTPATLEAALLAAARINEVDVEIHQHREVK